ncbi:Gfo/Idh/MocA family protein [Geobacter sp. SVR]|uniref:Gfo/Idh/MocA family protein n=1 Tax=Geobacter sp. SVR TaxID=2495594 RepID=UPI00143F0547|nr:Gfo/Idh/MocA family oxidoreductase [Geobacter sp. SVR]BCS52998.1 oxidoreductase [Geobacter sp. SVR]GCF84383.1 oxidoreductase [Geobacter sp. SVR]
MTRKKKLPRLGFLGTGWIGRHRLNAILQSGEAEITAIADISPENAREAAKTVPSATTVETLDDLLGMELDGLVIATPSAGHCSEAIRALDHGLAVFCQKPLGRNARETELVVAAARRSDRLLAVDYSYRFTDGIRKMHNLVRKGELGDIYAADLVFHNAYGPDKPWLYDMKLSGGGCLMDLGSHLVDLALWFFDFPAVRNVSSTIFAQGRQLNGFSGMVEDYAVVSLALENGAVVRLACSWNLPAGQDAVIESTFFGTKGGACFRNVNGSFYDFTAERFKGTARETIAVPPDDWGGRAAVSWCRQLRTGGGRFDPEAENLIGVAVTLDAAYGR